MKITSLVAAAALAAVPIAVLNSSGPATALANGLGRTPQLGWSSWNSFGCSISDALVRQTADAMVSSGMVAAGYQYVNLDDCWSTTSRDASGNLVADPNKFPHGMKALADYVHAKGLKLGIYSSAGTTTCSGYPGSVGHEVQDANLWASWGIDYLKYDYCGDAQGKTGLQRYVAMRDALAQTGRSIFYSLCNWGQDAVWTWGASVGNSWRTTGDISASFGSAMGILDQQVGKETYAGPGGWNDPDMLEVGNGLTDTESRAHFSLWALLNAPLLAGNDLRSMSQATIDILTDPDVLAVDQDWGGKAGYRVRDDGDSEVWAKPMSDGSVAVALLNRGSSTASISVTAAALGLGAGSSYSVRDLWANTTASTSGTVSASVPSHGAAFLRVSGGSPVTTTTTRPVTTTTTTRPTSTTTTTASITTTTTTTTTRPVTTTTTTRPNSTTTTTPTTTTTTTTRPSTTTSTGGAGKNCTAAYAVVGQWPGGFQGEVKVTNSGASSSTGWSLTWTFGNGQVVTQSWGGRAIQSGTAVTAVNEAWNGALSPGASATLGFLGNSASTNLSPTVTCTAV